MPKFASLEPRDCAFESFCAARDDGLVDAARETDVSGHAEAASRYGKDLLFLKRIDERNSAKAKQDDEAKAKAKQAEAEEANRRFAQKFQESMQRNLSKEQQQAVLSVVNDEDGAVNTFLQTEEGSTLHKWLFDDCSIPADVILYLEQNADKMEILGVDCQDTEEKWKAAVEEHQLPWLQVRCPEDYLQTLGQQYRIQGFPTKVIIDPEGRLVKVVVGEDPAFYTFLDQLFAK